MKLLLDENLSRRVVAKLLDVFPGTIHVADVDMLRTPDPDIYLSRIRFANRGYGYTRNRAG